MKRITYAGESILTGDEIAAAVLHYGRALAEAGVADTVTIPVAHVDGGRGEATLLIGPASQIVTEDAASDVEEVVDHAVLGELRDRERSLVPTAQPLEDLPRGWNEDT